MSTGKMLAAEQAGELCFRSPTSLLGYENNPSATAAFKDEDGWIHTGDYGYYDDEGFIFLTDRIKDLLKTTRHLQASKTSLCILGSITGSFSFAWAY